MDVHQERQEMAGESVDMANYTKQSEAREERKERDKTSRETLGKFFYDLAKLVFGTMTLVGAVSIITEDSDTGRFVLLGTGLFFTFVLAMVGYKVLNSK